MASRTFDVPFSVFIPSVRDLMEEELFRQVEVKGVDSTYIFQGTLFQMDDAKTDFVSFPILFLFSLLLSSATHSFGSNLMKTVQQFYSKVMPFWKPHNLVRATVIVSFATITGA